MKKIQKQKFLTFLTSTLADGLCDYLVLICRISTFFHLNKLSLIGLKGNQRKIDNRLSRKNFLRTRIFFKNFGLNNRSENEIEDNDKNMQSIQR